MEFDKTELELTKNIINIGLEKAAQSMAFFTKDKVEINSTDLQIKPLSGIGNLINKSEDEDLTVLSTEIIGDLGGICFLIFSKEEVKKILEVSLPESILKDEAKLAVMGDAILLEMDNIISASVITQLANALNYKMYGNVPTLQRTRANGFAQLFQSMNKDTSYFLYFRSIFRTTGLDINPDFIWLLDDKYLSGIKKVIEENSEVIQKIRKAQG